MFFRHDYATPGPGVDPNAPEKTGFARFIEIVQLECVTLVKLNLLFLVSCVPIITIPPALFAMNQVVRKMVLDQPVLCFYDYRTAFRKFFWNSYAAFLLTALPLVCAGFGLIFYLNRAAANLLFLLPFVVCSTIFLVAFLTAICLYGFLSTGRTLPESVRLALLFGLGKPFRPILAALSCYGPLLAAVLAFPISGLYLLLIGFSVPCLLGNFFLRTVLKPFSPAE